MDGIVEIFGLCGGDRLPGFSRSEGISMIMKENMQCVFYSMVYQYFSIVQVCIWCNLHHICYQSVAFRIGQLTSYLKTELKMRENNQGDSIKR